MSFGMIVTRFACIAQVGVFEESDQVGFRGFLQCHDGRRLKANVRLEVLCDLTNEALERQLADQQICAFLVATNFPQGFRAWSVGVASSPPPAGAVPCSLDGQVHSRCLSTGGFTYSLFRAWHFVVRLCVCVYVCVLVGSSARQLGSAARLGSSARVCLVVSPGTCLLV